MRTMTSKCNCKWVLNKTNDEYVDYLSKAVSISRPFAQVLINKGIKRPDQYNSFINPNVSYLPDPFELTGMQSAVNRIIAAKQRNEKVLICGDYDADGLSATSIMVQGLMQYGLDVSYFIPNRFGHGYGLPLSAITKAHDNGVSLIITVDCGITSFDSAQYAYRMGIDVIITDHHEPAIISDNYGQQSVSLPPASAIVNPKLNKGENSHFECLSGSGIALMVIFALFEMDINKIYHLLDIAALGTVADVVPLVSTNRIILRYGLDLIRAGNRLGIRALKNISGLKDDRIKSINLSYVIIPRINAAGRIDDANNVVKLFITNDENEAYSIAQWLNALNFKRQEMEEEILDEAIVQAKMQKDDKVLILTSKHWHPGVIGIVASKIVDQFNRPTIVLSIDGDIAKGSGRSISSFNLYDSLCKCSDLLIKYGGHKLAAGVTLKTCNVDSFKRAMSDLAERELSDEDLMQMLTIDAAVSISDITYALIKELQLLEPFGYGNEEPLFGAKDLEVVSAKVVGNNHLKMQLRQNRRIIETIGFNFGNFLDDFDIHQPIDTAFYPQLQEYNGSKQLRLNLKAIRQAGYSYTA